MVLLAFGFVVGVLMVFRFSERVVAFVTLVFVLASAGVLLYLSNEQRAQAPLMMASLLLGGTFVLTRLLPFKGPAPKTSRKVNLKSMAMQTEEGIRIEGYSIMERIGAGGMAEVYKAKRHEDEKEVAIKVPLDRKLEDNKQIRRFYQEAATLKRLNHINIVEVFEYNMESVPQYIVMEYVNGQTIDGFMVHQLPSIPEAMVVVRAVADALAYIHKEGLIHRDIKPSNVMLVRRTDNEALRPEHIKVMDFGVAVGQVFSRNTLGSGRVGTPVYMSPEQANRGSVDGKSDVYSLGMVFYEMLTGRTPFGGGPEALFKQHISDDPTPPNQINLEIPSTLNDLIMRMLAKDPTNRPSATQVTEALDALSAENARKTIVPSGTRLLISARAEQGFIRILDDEGRLVKSYTELDQPEMGSPPVAVAAYPGDKMLVCVVNFKNPTSPMMRVIHNRGDVLQRFGVSGLRNGQFLNPIALSVSPRERLYVLDADLCSIQELTFNGDCLRKFGNRGMGKGTFQDPKNIATTAQEIYVLDMGLREIQRFNHQGEYTSRIAIKLPENESLNVLDGLAVDAQGHVYISDLTSKRIRKLTPAGQSVQSYPLEDVAGELAGGEMLMTIDSDGFLYAVRRNSSIIRKYAPDGVMVSAIEAFVPVMAIQALEPVGNTK